MERRNVAKKMIEDYLNREMGDAILGDCEVKAEETSRALIEQSVDDVIVELQENVTVEDYTLFYDEYGHLDHIEGEYCCGFNAQGVIAQVDDVKEMAWHYDKCGDTIYSYVTGPFRISSSIIESMF